MELIPPGGWENFDRHEELVEALWHDLTERDGNWKYINLTAGSSVWESQLDGSWIASFHECGGDERLLELTVTGKTAQDHVMPIAEAFGLEARLSVALGGRRATDTFNDWFLQPLPESAGRTVQAIMADLNQHPLAQDSTAQDRLTPTACQRRQPGRFSLCDENQGNWNCFVLAGAEHTVDPPVYFASTLDLQLDHGIDPDRIVDGTHVQVCPRFGDFLWHLLAQHVCVRTEANGLFRAGVSGIVFASPPRLDKRFVNPLGQPFPGEPTAWVADGVVCVPEWGAAFRTPVHRDAFLRELRPDIAASWG